MTLADVAWPADAGKRLRAESMVRAVAEHCDLDVAVLFADADPRTRPIPPDIEANWQVVPARLRSRWLTAIVLASRRVPWQIAVQDWRPIRKAVTEGGGRYDLVWFGALDHFARLHDVVHAGKVVVDCDDVETEKLRGLLAMTRTTGLPWTDRVQRRVELPLWARIQRRTLQAADAVLVCSDLDRSRLVAQAARSDPASAARVISIPNTYPEPTNVLRRLPAQGSRCTLVIVANFGTDQNVDAAFFAARQLLPVLRQAIPAARIRMVGRRPDRLRVLEGIPGLDIVGPVDSVATELAGADAVLVPIRFGGGTRLKVIEAFAYGVPVVSTRLGAEGIDALDGEHLLLADSPDEITAAVLRLRCEPALNGQLSVAGRALYERSYRPREVQERIDGMLGQLLGADRLTTARPATTR
jgi:glycosyltransferase involved in cell wall biosynthesis